MNYKSRKKLKEALKTAHNWIEHLEKENHELESRKTDLLNRIDRLQEEKSELIEKEKAILRGDRVVTPACDVCKFSVKSKNTFIGFESTYCSLDCKCKDFERT